MKFSPEKRVQVAMAQESLSKDATIADLKVENLELRGIIAQLEAELSAIANPDPINPPVTPPVEEVKTEPVIPVQKGKGKPKVKEEPATTPEPEI